MLSKIALSAVAGLATMTAVSTVGVTDAEAKKGGGVHRHHGHHHHFHRWHHRHHYHFGYYGHYHDGCWRYSRRWHRWIYICH